MSHELHQLFDPASSTFTYVLVDLPTREDVVEVKITESSVVNGTTPLLELAPTKRKKEA